MPMAEFQRLKVDSQTPLTPGFYEFVGEVEGSPERTTKTEIQNYLRQSTRLGERLDVIDWVRVSGSVWRVQVRIKSLPTQAALEPGTAQIALAPIVWVVGLLAAALVAGYGIWRFNQTKLEMFQLIPEKDRKVVAVAQTLNVGVIAVLGLLLVFLAVRR